MPILKPPITAAEVPDEWPGIVRQIVQRDGNAIRGLGDRPVIEIKSLTTNKWCLLALPSGTTLFQTFDDRNIVLARIRGE